MSAPTDEWINKMCRSPSTRHGPVERTRSWKLASLPSRLSHTGGGGILQTQLSYGMTQALPVKDKRSLEKGMPVTGLGFLENGRPPELHLEEGIDTSKERQGGGGGRGRHQGRSAKVPTDAGTPLMTGS